jgi:crossover junction endodeoxyribonuclease RuvC
LIVLGIDPGISSTGYGLVEARTGNLRMVAGDVLATDEHEALERRLGCVMRGIEKLIEEHEPSALAVEEIYFGRNVRTAFAVGQARGAVLASAGRCDVPCFSYTPQQIKRAVCGAGGAGKQQVQRMVAALLGLSEPPRPDHVADALAVAICHASSEPARIALQASVRTSR